MTNYITKPVRKNCKLEQLPGQINTTRVLVSDKVNTSVTNQIPSAGAGWHSYQHTILTFNFHFSPLEKCGWETENSLSFGQQCTCWLCFLPSQDCISPPRKSSTEGTQSTLLVFKLISTTTKGRVRLFFLLFWLFFPLFWVWTPISTLATEHWAQAFKQ